MSLVIECEKLKRTGYFTAFLAGGFLAAGFSCCLYDGKSRRNDFPFRNPMDILMAANWQMMDMLNILFPFAALHDVPHGICRLTVCRKCRCFPIRQENMFFGNL